MNAAGVPVVPIMRTISGIGRPGRSRPGRVPELDAAGAGGAP